MEVKDWQKGKRIFWQQFKRPELEEYAKNVCDIAFLPLGSIEQHGEHLPTGEDTYHALGIAERVAEKTGVMILPTPWYGAHPYQHYYYAGTIPLRFETYYNLIMDIVKGASYAGFNKFILFNSHGQEWALDPAVQQLGLEGYFVVAPTLWHIAKEDIGEIMETGFFHAEESETSLGLHLVPELVDMSKAHDETSEKLIDPKWLSVPGTKLTRHMHWHSTTFAMPEYKHLKHGVIGWPTKATAEKGKALVDAAVKWLVEFINEIKEKYPPGVKPAVK